MSSILDQLASQLGPQTIRHMSAQIGAQPAQTASAIEAALPMLLGQLQRNAASPDTAGALLGALSRDHDGGLLDDLAGLLGGGPSAADQRSLDHIFGGKRAPVENAVARRSGLDGGQVMKLLAMLAPMVLAVLGKAMRGGAGQGRATAPSSGGGLGDLLGGLLGGGSGSAGGASGGGDILSDLLGGAMGKMQNHSPGIQDMLGGLLDADHDGSIVDDLLEKGLGGGSKSPSSGDLLGGLLGGLLKG